MAVLVDADRASVCADVQRRVASVWGGAVKADLRAAINGIDDGIEANAATINQWIPQPARSILSAQDKALLLAYVCLKKAGR